MQRRLVRHAAAAALVTLAGLAALPGDASAARVGVLSNNYVAETTADFAAHVAGHTFTPVDTSATAPSLASLMANFDVLLLFEDGPYPNAPVVGNVVAAYANSGRAVVIGTFYDQDRSDASPITLTPHGWGALESIDPNTTDGVGTAYSPRTLDPASIGPHPLTAGVTSLFATSFAGGNQPKPGTIVVANWREPNALGNPDPAIAYRVTGPACVIHIAIAPNYPSIVAAAGDFGGDFYQAWGNAFSFGANRCVVGTGSLPASWYAIPTLSETALALTALLLAASAGIVLARRRARR